MSKDPGGHHQWSKMYLRFLIKGRRSHIDTFVGNITDILIHKKQFTDEASAKINTFDN